MANRNQKIGKWGEEIAAEFLAGQGFKILQANYHTPHGEIDLIAKKENLIVFVEVKTRTNLSFGYPEDAVNDLKKSHLFNSVQYYLQKNETINDEMRVDVLSILARSGSAAPEIEWFKDVVSGVE